MISTIYSEQEAKVANIVIRRQHLRGAYGDIGFARQPDGQLAMIKDELDEHRGYGAKWLGRAQQGYKEKQTLRQQVPSSSFGLFSGYGEWELVLGRYSIWGRDYSEADLRRLWEEIRGHLDFAVLGRFNETQPSALPLRTSRSQALRMLTTRYGVKDYGPQSVK